MALGQQIKALTAAQPQLITDADIDRLMQDTFGAGRDPRSEQYRKGARTVLECRLLGTPIPPMPYTLGTAAADAYFSGQEEGRAVYLSLRKAIIVTEPMHVSRSVPQCDNCRHMAKVRTEQGAVRYCDHPSLPVNVPNGAPVVPCAVAREIRGYAPYQGVCGESAALFQGCKSALPKNGGAA